MGKRRWDRSQYPDDWEEISHSKKVAASWTCEFCGNEHGKCACNKRGGEYTAYMAAAHKWAGDTHNPDPELYCLCQSCHRKYDNSFQTAYEEEEKVWCDHPDCQGYFLPHEH